MGWSICRSANSAIAKKGSIMLKELEQKTGKRLTVRPLRFWDVLDKLDNENKYVQDCNRIKKLKLSSRHWKFKEPEVVIESGFDCPCNKRKMQKEIYKGVEISGYSTGYQNWAKRWHICFSRGDNWGHYTVTRGKGEAFKEVIADIKEEIDKKKLISIYGHKI